MPFPTRFDAKRITKENHKDYITFINNLPSYAANLVYRRAIGKEIISLDEIDDKERIDILKFIIASTTTINRELALRF